MSINRFMDASLGDFYKYPFTPDISKMIPIEGEYGGWYYGHIRWYSHYGGYVYARSSTISYTVGIYWDTTCDFKIVDEDNNTIIDTTLARTDSGNYTKAGYGAHTFFDGSFSATIGKKYYIYKIDAFMLRDTSGILINENNGEDFDAWGYPVKYIYVPNGCNEVVTYYEVVNIANSTIYYRKYGDATWKNDGIVLKNWDSNKWIIKYLISEADQGAVWAFEFKTSFIDFKTLPNIMALQPFTYTT